MRRRVTEVLGRRVVILDRAVPHVPLPHDSGTVWRLRFELDNHVGPQTGFRGQGGQAPGLGRLLGRLPLPGDGQDVAIGHHGDVVMEEMLLAGEGEVPHQVAVPRELLQPPGLAAAAKHRDIGLADTP